MALQVLLDGGVGRFGVFGMVSGVAVVKVEKVLAMAAIGIVPLQLGLEGMVLLREVLLPVVVGVAPSVPPFKYLVGRHIDVLEHVTCGVISIAPGSGESDGPLGRARRGGLGVRIPHGHAH